MNCQRNDFKPPKYYKNNLNICNYWVESMVEAEFMPFLKEDTGERKTSASTGYLALF